MGHEFIIQIPFAISSNIATDIHPLCLNTVNIFTLLTREN